MSREAQFKRKECQKSGSSSLRSWYTHWSQDFWLPGGAAWTVPLPPNTSSISIDAFTIHKCHRGKNAKWTSWWQGHLNQWVMGNRHLTQEKWSLPGLCIPSKLFIPLSLRDRRKWGEQGRGPEELGPNTINWRSDLSLLKRKGPEELSNLEGALKGKM